MSSDHQFEKDWREDEERVSPRAGLGSGGGQDPEPESNPEMVQALCDFRRTVHAWSEAAYQGPKAFEVAPQRIAWHKAAAWAVAGVLVVGSAGGGLREYQHRQEQARIAAARQAELQRQMQEERAREAEEELAQVENDVSRQVPNALEPLAQLMTSDGSQ